MRHPIPLFLTLFFIQQSTCSAVPQQHEQLYRGAVQCPGSSFLSHDHAHLSFDLGSSHSCKELKKLLESQLSRSTNKNLSRVEVKCAPFRFNYGNMPTLFFKTGSWDTNQPRPEEEVQFVVIRHRNQCIFESDEEVRPQNYPDDEFVLSRSFSDPAMNVALTRILIDLSKNLHSLSSRGNSWVRQHTRD